MVQEDRPVIANVDRLHEHMDREGFSAVVLRSGTNFSYLAGFAFPGTLGRHLELPDSPREVLLVWPRHGDPVLVLNHVAEPIARRDSWVNAIELYQGYTESPYAKVAEVLGRMGLQDAKLGLEKSYINSNRWEEMQGLLPRAQLMDCATMMAEVRWIKTPGEVERIRRAADILDEAYLEVFSTVKRGDAEREVHGRIVGACIQRGAQWAHGMLSSSRNDVMYGGESEMQFQPGDIIRNDYVSYYLGYPGHQNRVAVMGEPSAEQRRLYGTVRDIYRATIDRCKPGVKAIDVYQYAVGAFRREGFTERFNIVGHGVGPWWHQQEPYIVDHTTAVLEAGMVLAMEPGVSHWRLQDLVLITDEGPELLSTRFSTDEMFVIE